MDLGCLDLGCISSSDKQSSGSSLSVDLQKTIGAVDAEESVMATTKFGKSKSPKGTGQSTLNSVNKSTSQIKKSNRKNSSPLNWFPRKKTDSYLKRKIKLLQEVGGMNLTLDETLGDSNPHYSRVLREKMAAKEAASKAMEARKAALVEASWCRILRAARIHRKEAELLLLKAEKNVEEAFEAAAAVGVIMYDRPDYPPKPCVLESSSANTGGLTTHTVTASFETAFDVDKEVAAAVKAAFVRLAHYPSSLNKEDFRDLLRKISQNPDTTESEISSECESDSGSEQESHIQIDGMSDNIQNSSLKQRKCKDRRLPRISNSVKLVDMMLERLKCLQDDELASLATIVATCGLNAALREVQNNEVVSEANSDCTRNFSSQEAGTAKYSNMEHSSKDHQMRRKQVVSEIPSLDKFLVKHMSRLEKEVQEAKNTRNNEAKGIADNPIGSDNIVDHSIDNVTSAATVPDLGSILIKHASKLEKDIDEAKKKSAKHESDHRLGRIHAKSEVPSLDKFLVKRVSRLEREVQEARKREKEKVINETDANMKGSHNRLGKNKQDVSEVPSLDTLLVKHVSKLEKEVQEAKIRRNHDAAESNNSTAEASNETSSDSVMASSRDFPDSNDTTNSSFRDGTVNKENIDSNKQAGGLSDGTVKESHEMGYVENKSLMMVQQGQYLTSKHMSRIERAKLETQGAFSSKDGNGKKEGYISLDSILVKPAAHRLEREKMQAVALGRGYGTYRDQRNHGGVDDSGCESLDKVLIKHVSRLEKEKMDAKEEVMKVGRRNMLDDKKVDGLDQILVKHQSRLEMEKLAASQQSGDQTVKHPESRREAKVRELQEAWGGLSLGNSIRPYVSRLEREKAAWIKAEEEERELESTI